MISYDSRLARHLAVAVAVKLAALAVIWWCFVRDVRVDVGADGVEARLLSPSSVLARPGRPAQTAGALK